MKVVPISIATAGADSVESEVRSGVVNVGGKDERRGWEVRFDDQRHRLLLPTGSFRSIFGAKFDLDDDSIALPRGVGFRKTAEFAIAGHPARLELWQTFEPIRHWAGGGNIRRAGFFAVLGGLVSAGVGAGLAAGSMNQRLFRDFARLRVDDLVAGTWVSTSAIGDAPRWRHLAPDVDLDVVAADWDQSERTFRGEPELERRLDDMELAEAIGRFSHEPDGWMSLDPADRRAFTVSLGSEPAGTRGLILVARVPQRPVGRRAALGTAGWVVEPDPWTGTRHYVSRYPINTAAESSAAVADLRSAYVAVYGPRFLFDSWKVRSRKAATVRGRT